MLLLLKVDLLSLLENSVEGDLVAQPLLLGPDDVLLDKIQLLLLSGKESLLICRQLEG